MPITNYSHIKPVNHRADPSIHTNMSKGMNEPIEASWQEYVKEGIDLGLLVVVLFVMTWFMMAM